MPVVSRYNIRFDDRLGGDDITSYTLGFTTQATAGIGELGRMDCIVTVDNNDGSFTPAEGGGTGQFANVDWYSKRLRIYEGDPVSVGGNLFIGIIRDVTITDDGVNSFATIRAVDWSQVATSEPFNTTQEAVAIDVDLALRNTVEGTNNWGDGFTIQKFGDPTVASSFSFAKRGTFNFKLRRPALTDVTTKDMLNTVLLPSGPIIHIPGGISYQYSGTPLTQLSAWIMSPTLDYQFPTEVNFSETPSTSPVKLPFTDLVVGFNTDDVTNQTYVESGVTGLTPQTVINTTSIDKYGSRPRFYNRTANESENDLVNVAGFWTNRQSSVRYTPTRIQLTTSSVDARLPSNANVASAVLNLLRFETCLFRRLNITYTPTNGATITVPVVVKSRRVDATPTDTRITLELLPGVDYASFTLDDAQLGVLGGTFETYEDPDVLYDEPDELYDGLQISGNRLG